MQQQNLFCFFSPSKRGSSKLEVEESETTKEDDAGGVLFPEDTITPEGSSQASLPAEPQTVSDPRTPTERMWSRHGAGCMKGKRNFQEGEFTARKRRRNDSSETERESISPNTSCVRTVPPPPSQGDLPNAPRKCAHARPEGVNPLRDLKELLKEDVSSNTDLLDEKTLLRLDQLDVGAFQQNFKKNMPDLTEMCEPPPPDPAAALINRLLHTRNIDSHENVFEGATLRTESAQKVVDDDDHLLNHYLYQIPHLRDDLMWTKYVEMYYKFRRLFCLPSWINPQKLRDLQGKLPEDPEFDFSHIRWPGAKSKLGVDDKMHFTPAMTQYWEIKSSNFDSIIFFKLGKFYEMFYTDSMIAQEILGLQWMGNDSKAHVGFPESSLTAYGKQLVNFGFRVCVVEQMETPEELQRRKSTGATDDQAVKRSICEIYTKGTVTHEKMLGALPSYLSSMYLYRGTTPQKSWELAIVQLDVACCTGYYTIIQETESSFCNIRNFVTQWLPREILLDGGVAAEDLLKLRSILEDLAPNAVIRKELNAKNRVQTRIMGEEQLSKFYNTQDQQETLIEWVKNHPSEAPLRALEQLCYHLEKTLLAERIVECTKFTRFPDLRNFLTVNSSSVHNLDIMPGLFATINYTITKIGERMLRQWLSQPLLNIEEIKARQNGVRTLIETPSLARIFRKGFETLPSDLERQYARISSQILRQKDNSGKSAGPVYFSETITKKISEFVNMIDSFIKINSVIKQAQSSCAAVSGEDSKSDDENRLRAVLFKYYDAEGIKNMTQSIMVEIDIDNMVPRRGISHQYDSANDLVQKQKRILTEHLKSGDVWCGNATLAKSASAEYVNSKFRYEIEVSEKTWKELKKTDPTAQMTSTRKGFVRFHNDFVKEELNKLVKLESEGELQLHPWLGEMIRSLSRNHGTLISHTLALVSEIDCLFSLSRYYSSFDYMVFPEPLAPQNGDSLIKLTKCYHPIMVSNSKIGSSFIPNDIEIRSGESIVITGPNMGGKSTFSRQIALNIILAQIGAPIPAQGPCEFSVFHSIFTRIGLKDFLAASKSTFMVELEDVLEMLRFASKNSILLIDEFGRGTNSREGALLAATTLYYITQRLGPAVVFSTHFPLQKVLQSLAQELKDTEVLQRILYKHLGAVINNDALVFTYRLAPGVFPESHGLRVAELAGISKEILELSLT